MDPDDEREWIVLHEWCFVDPSTIKNGKDHRGWDVVELWAPDGSGPPTSGFFVQQFGIWPEAIDKFAAQQAAYADHLEAGNDPKRAAAARGATRTETRTHLAKIRVP